MSKFLSLAGSLAGSAIAIALMSPFIIGPIKSFVKGPEQFSPLVLVEANQAQRLQALTPVQDKRTALYLSLVQQLEELKQKIQQEGRLTQESAEKLFFLREQFKKLLQGKDIQTGEVQSGQFQVNQAEFENQQEKQAEKARAKAVAEQQEEVVAPASTPGTASASAAPAAVASTTGTASAPAAPAPVASTKGAASAPAAPAPVASNSGSAPSASAAPAAKTPGTPGTVASTSRTATPASSTPKAEGGKVETVVPGVKVTAQASVPAAVVMNQAPEYFVIQAEDHQFKEFSQVFFGDVQPVAKVQDAPNRSQALQFYQAYLTPAALDQLTQRTYAGLARVVEKIKEGQASLNDLNKSVRFYVFYKDSFTPHLETNRQYFEEKTTELANLVVENFYAGKSFQDATNKIYLKDQVRTCLASGLELDDCINGLAYSLYKHQHQANLQQYQDSVSKSWDRFDRYVHRNYKVKFLHSQDFNNTLVTNLNQLQLALKVVAEQFMHQPPAMQHKQVVTPVKATDTTFVNLKECLVRSNAQVAIQELVEKYKSSIKEVDSKKPAKDSVKTKSSASKPARQDDSDAQDKFMQLAQYLLTEAQKLDKQFVSTIELVSPKDKRSAEKNLKDNLKTLENLARNLVNKNCKNELSKYTKQTA